MSSAGQKAKKPGAWLPGVIISVLFIVAFIFFIDWGEFAEAVQTIQPSVILWTVVLTIIPLCTRSLAWRFLLDREITFKDAFFGENIGYMANNFLPFRLGEIARAVLLSDKVKGGFAAVLPSIFVERLIDLGFAAVTLLIAIPFVVSESWMLPSVLVSVGIVGVGGLFLTLSLLKADLLQSWIKKLFARMPAIQKTVLRLFHQFIVGLKAAAQGKNAIWAILFLAMTWISYWVSYYVLIVSVAPQAKFIWALFTDGVVSLGIAIPSAPGSLGVWEASFVAALAVFGVEESKSLAVGIILHLVSYAVTGIFGIIGFAVFGSSLSNLLQRVNVQRQQSTETGKISGGE